MPRSGGNQKLRLIYLYKLLFTETDEQHPISRDRLFELLQSRYDISLERKTFYDDLQYLEMLGADVQKGEGKGTYFLASREFELPELHLLVDAIQSSQFITPKKSAQLIDKLATLCSHYQGEQLKSQVFLSARNKTVNESIYYNIDAIYQAIAGGKQLSYRYFSPDFKNGKLEKAYRREGARYLVSPLSVAWQDEKYYLIAFDHHHNQIRHYRIDKMENIEVESTPADVGDQPFDGGAYAAKFFNMYGGEEQQVTLRFTKDLLGVALDQFGAAAHLRPDDENHFLLITNVAVSPGFYGFLFSLQDRVELLSPSECVKEFKAALKKVQENY
ncbi:MAG: WYL domain-containing protein [Clostridia bacterium]|nr:WYL domain-containing protein [Clostridia bacterium]